MGDLNEMLNEKGIVKCVTKDYVIYRRDWLFEHLDFEFDMQKKYGEWKSTMQRDKLMEMIRAIGGKVE